MALASDELTLRVALPGGTGRSPLGVQFGPKERACKCNQGRGFLCSQCDEESSRSRRNYLMFCPWEFSVCFGHAPDSLINTLSWGTHWRPTNELQQCGVNTIESICLCSVTLSSRFQLSKFNCCCSKFVQLQFSFLDTE